MKPSVLMIGRDPSIFSDNPIGDLHKRMRHYAAYYDYTCLTAICDRCPTRKWEGNVEYLGLSKNPVLFLWDGFKELKNKKIQVINTQDPFITGFLGWSLRLYFRIFKGWKIPLIIDLHSEMLDNPAWIQEKWYNILLNFCGKALLKRADYLHVVSPTLRNQMVALGIPPLKVFVIPVGTDIQIAEASQEVRKENTILFVGRLVPQKNVQLLLKAFATLLDSGKDLHLRIVGAGPEEENLENLCMDLGIQNEVSFLGRLSDSDLKNEYQTASCLVLPSNHEGWGLVVVEAMAHNLPVVVSSAVARVNPIISHNETALVFQEGEQRLLMDALINIFSPEAKEDNLKMVECAKRRIKDYDIRKTAEMKGRMFELIVGENE